MPFLFFIIGCSIFNVYFYFFMWQRVNVKENLICSIIKKGQSQMPEKVKIVMIIIQAGPVQEFLNNPKL